MNSIRKGEDSINIEVDGQTFKIPNVVATVVLVGLTASFFWIGDDPRWSSIASLGLIALVMIAKWAEINFGDILTVLGRTEEDLPDLPPGVSPLGQAAPRGEKTDPDPPTEVRLKHKDKVRSWLLN